MIIGIQILAIIFSFSMIYFAVINYKKKDLSFTEVASWTILWIATTIFVIFPELLRRFSMTFLVTRVFDFMVIVGFILVISMSGSAYMRVRRNEKKIEDLVRYDAIRNADKTRNAKTKN